MIWVVWRGQDLIGGLLFSNGEKSGDSHSPRTDGHWLPFTKNLCPKPSTWPGVPASVCSVVCGRRMRQCPLWGTRQPPHVFIPSQNQPTYKLTQLPSHQDFWVEADTQQLLSKDLARSLTAFQSSSFCKKHRKNNWAKKKGKWLGEGRKQREAWKEDCGDQDRAILFDWISRQYHLESKHKRRWILPGGSHCQHLSWPAESNYSHNSCRPDVDGQSHTRTVPGMRSSVIQRGAVCFSCKVWEFPES